MSNYKPIEIIGYRPHNSIVSPEVLACYGDYKCGRMLAREQFQADLNNGNLPQGLLIRDKSKLYVVKGVLNAQRVEAL